MECGVWREASEPGTLVRAGALFSFDKAHFSLSKRQRERQRLELCSTARSPLCCKTPLSAQTACTTVSHNVLAWRARQIRWPAPPGY